MVNNRCALLLSDASFPEFLDFWKFESAIKQSGIARARTEFLSDKIWTSVSSQVSQQNSVESTGPLAVDAV